MAKRAIFSLHTWKDGGDWLGECLELGTATYGETEAQVLEELVELVKLTVDGLADIGELDQVLLERGVTVYEETRPNVVNVPPVTFQDEGAVRYRDFEMATSSPDGQLVGVGTGGS